MTTKRLSPIRCHLPALLGGGFTTVAVNVQTTTVLQLIENILSKVQKKNKKNKKEKEYTAQNFVISLSDAPNHPLPLDKRLQSLSNKKIEVILETISISEKKLVMSKKDQERERYKLFIKQLFEENQEDDEYGQIASQSLVEISTIEKKKN